MSKAEGYKGQVGSIVQNTAACDSFVAPDSTSRRPDPEGMADRSRSPQQPPATAIEANLNGESQEYTK